MKDKKIWLIVLAVLLFVALCYIAFDKYSEAREAERFGVYQLGLQAGYEQAVVALMNEAASCKEVELYSGNQTINVVAVGCLQVPSGQE